MLRTICAATLLALLGLSAQPAKADLILSPTAVIRNDFGEFTSSESGITYGITNVIDQSGLNSTFSSGVDNYDAYLATNPQHSGNSAEEGSGIWIGGLDSPSGGIGVIDFDLGERLNILSLAFFSNPIRGFTSDVEVFTSFNEDFSNAVSVGTFQPETGLSVSPVSAQDIELLASRGRYVRFQMQDSHFGARPGFGEVAFEVSAVPEPATLPLLIGGAAGVFFLRRRLKKRAQA